MDSGKFLRYFIDAEFIEDGKTIDLISIGIVCSDGREYYALNYDCDYSKASDWVKENVLSLLPLTKPAYPDFGNPNIYASGWRNLLTIRDEVSEFLNCKSFAKPPLPPQYIPRSFEDSIGWRLKKNQETPEFWADYASYDWVALCQLFGTMMDLPEGFPMYCNDIQQYKRMLGGPDFPAQTEGLHTAIGDARWVKSCWEHLRSIDPNVRREGSETQPEFDRKILNISAAIVEHWTDLMGGRTCSDTPTDVLVLMEELSPEAQDHLHQQYELMNSRGEDYVKGAFMMNSALLVGGSIEIALKTLRDRTA